MSLSTLKNYRPFNKDKFARLFKKIKSLIDTRVGICSNSERLMSKCSHASRSDEFFCLKCFASACPCNLPGGAVTRGRKSQSLGAVKSAAILSVQIPVSDSNTPENYLNPHLIPHIKKMDPIDIRTLKILEKVDNDGTPSQRDLARDLDISLGLVNSFIKRLAKKGYFKIGHLPKNRVRYIMTARGVAEKSRLTSEYIQFSFKFYRNARQKLRDLYANLEAQGVRRIVFYGAGDLAEIAYLSLQQSCIELVAVVDAGRVGKNFMQFTVAHPDRIVSLWFDRILIATIHSTEAVAGNLATMGISANRVVEIT